MFVLRDIVRLPDAEIVDQPNGNCERSGFEVRLKAIGAVLQFNTHLDDTRIKWLREIGHYASDPLALHEHAVDDLRIDATQVKADTDADAFRLPPRIDAYQPDTVKPSEVAQDYLPTAVKQQQQSAAVLSSSVVETLSTKQQQQQTAETTTIATAKSSTIEVKQSAQQASVSATSTESSQIETHTGTNVKTKVELKSVVASQKSTAITSEASQVEIKNQINVLKTAEEAQRVEAKNQLNLSQSLASSQIETKQLASATSVTEITKEEPSKRVVESSATVTQATASNRKQTEDIVAKPKSPESIVQGIKSSN